MVAVRIVFRWLRMASWGAWVGGFGFYGGVVVPILHESLGDLEAGDITRRVTNVLNRLGLATLAIWALAFAIDRQASRRSVRRAQAAGLVVSAALLAFLFATHRTMDRHLDSGSLADFYPLHRAYLIASTAQWVVNLLVLACWAVDWTARPPTGGPPS